MGTFWCMNNAICVINLKKKTTKLGSVSLNHSVKLINLEFFQPLLQNRIFTAVYNFFLFIRWVLFLGLIIVTDFWEQNHVIQKINPKNGAFVLNEILHLGTNFKLYCQSWQDMVKIFAVSTVVKGLINTKDLFYFLNNNLSCANRQRLKSLFWKGIWHP